jgi:type IV pilus assembly protein PilM
MMSLLSQPRIDLSRWLARNERGWIGVDIGSRAIKLAQVERKGGRHHIAARWTLVEGDGLLTREKLGSGELAVRSKPIASLARMFRDRRCAAVIPMAAMDLRSLSIPAATPQEQRQMVAEELAADLAIEPEKLAFDFWKNRNVGQSSDLVEVTAMALPQEIAAKTATDLLQAGLECQTLDVLPCAIARAVELCDPQQANEAAIAIDLGYQSPLLVLVQQGQPLYCRALRGGGVQSMMQPLEQSLGISPAECHQLLLRWGIGQQADAAAGLAGAMMRLLSEPVDCLLSEIQRTIGFIAQQFTASPPKRIWLLGGGAAIRHLPEYLASHLGLPVQPWSIDADRREAADAQYAVAAALSILTWEGQPCT